MRGFRTVIAAAAMLLAASVSIISAQVGAGQITGIVTDANGEAVPGAAVVATNLATTNTREGVTSIDGVYALPNLLPGVYRVDVTLSGFGPSRRDDVQVMTGATIRMDFSLKLATVSEALTVTAGAPVLRATASLGEVVTEERVVGLPLNGRSFINLTALVPGVALPPSHIAAPLPRINGGRPRTNEYLFDGISVLQPEPGQIAFFPIIDAIQEFKVETNSPPAEFGRFNGGVINLTTKAGSNSYRGSAFEFFRHEDLAARNYFSPQTGDKPKYRRDQAGFVAGGPLVKNRTFFFADYQGQRQNIARPLTSTVPTVLQRQGIFTETVAGRTPAIYDPTTQVPNGNSVTRTQFANGTIPLEKMDPVALALIQRYPMPTSSGTANNYFRVQNELDDQDQWDVRIDHVVTEKDHVFARLSNFNGRFRPAIPLPDGSGTPTGALGPQDTIAWSFASNYTRTISANVLNELRVGDTRRSVERSAATLSGTPSQVLGLPGIPTDGAFANTLPTFIISGGPTQLGSAQSTASDFSTSVTEIADTLTWLKGRHAFKAGFDWRWERLNVVQPPSPTGRFTFNTLGTNQPGTANTGLALASFLMGQVQSFEIDTQESKIQERAHFQEYFIQDDWKVTNRFTVNAGLRYTLNFPSNEINGQVGVFNMETQLLEYPGDEPVRPLKKDNFGPRLGLSYLVTEKTLASAGYGIVWIEMAGITTPFTTPTFPFIQNVAQRSLDQINPAFLLRNGPSVAPLEPTPTAGLGQGVFAVDATLGSGYVQQWNGSVQRELTRNTSVEVAYVGSKITRVGIPDPNINQLSQDQLKLGATLQELVPNPYFGIIPRSSSLGDPTISRAQLLKPFPQYTTVVQYRNNVGNTNYHGVTFKYNQRYSRGLSYTLAYTRSRLMDDASSVFDASILTGPQNNVSVADAFHRELERDYSTGDIPHLFVGSAVWDIPAGRGRQYQPSGVLGVLASDWTVSTFITLQSGVPVAISQATNNNAFAGFTTQRPNLVGDPELPADQRSPSKWFNTAAFVPAAIFEIGTSSRNPVRGPSYRSVDMAVTRRIPTTATTWVEMRVEAFNLLNTTQFGNPNAQAGNAAFGTITSAGDPRVIQLAVKFAF